MSGIITETERVGRLILQGKRRGLSELQFFAAELQDWRDSPRRKEQLQGERYYRGQQDILRRQRTVIGTDGKLQTVDNLPNNRIVDNQYALMVDQKTNYLVGKPITLNCRNKTYTAQLGKVFGRRFGRLLKYVCEDALNGGLGWLYPYYDREGQLAFQHFPAYDILPFWADDDHTTLDCALRYYTQEVWNGYTKEIVERVELFKDDGLWRYLFQHGQLIPDVELGEHENYFTVDMGGQTQEFNWTRIPLIPFKYNKQEVPLLCRVKTLQDGINTMLSDFADNMQEDARNTILILKNYDGENLGQFRHNLATYGAVKVRSDGGVETLQVEVNADNYQSILKLLKQSLIENARGYDAKDDRLSGNPNQMNIQSMYSDIDLDANGMETEFQAAFSDLLWFIDQDFVNRRGLGDFSGEDLQIVFNRDILINESESIDNCSKSLGILSNETIVEQHPWVSDVDLELARLRKEQDEAMARAPEYTGAFGGGEGT